MIYLLVCFVIFLMFAQPLSPRSTDVDRRSRPSTTFFSRHPSLGVLALTLIILAATVVDSL